MNANDLDRLLAGWMDDDAHSGRPIAGLDRVLDATRRRRPRPAWFAGPGSRWVDGVAAPGGRWPGASIARPGVAWSKVLALALLALALVGAAVFAAGQLRTAPAPVGDAYRLAYFADDALYLADWDGADSVRVDAGSQDGAMCTLAGNERGVWSPDGRHLAIRAVHAGSDGCTQGFIHIHDAEGRAVASYPTGTGWRIAWAPDASRLAAWWEFGLTIDVRGLDGGLQARLTMPPYYSLGGDWDPVWGPDDASVVVRDVRLPIDGSEPHQWGAEAGRRGVMPITSANREIVAFYGFGDALLVAPPSDLRAARPLLGRERTVAMGMFRQLFVSPAGDLVAVPTMRDRMLDNDGNLIRATWELVVIDVASGDVRTLLTTRDEHRIRPLGFSPDGRRVLYSMEDGASPSLWSANTDGSGSRLLVPGVRWGEWQPAGR